MAALAPSGKSLPTSFAAAYLRILVDVIGPNGVDAMLRRAGLVAWAGHPPQPPPAPTVDFAEVSALLAGVEETIGVRGERGLARRMGAAVFEEILRPLGPIAAIRDPSFQALPEPRRLRAGLHAVVHVLAQTGHWEHTTHEVENGVAVRCEACPHCWGRSSDAPVCGATLGLLLAAAHWTVPEAEVTAEETACRARRDPACEFTLRLGTGG